MDQSKLRFRMGRVQEDYRKKKDELGQTHCTRAPPRVCAALGSPAIASTCRAI